MSGTRQICALCTIALYDALVEDLDPFKCRRKHNLVKNLMDEAKKVYTYAVHHNDISVLANITNANLMHKLKTNIAEKMDLVEMELSPVGRALYRCRISVEKPVCIKHLLN